MEPTTEGGPSQPEPFAQAAPPGYAVQPEAPYPTFCKTIFIIDACFSGLRALLIPFAIIGLFVLRKQDSQLFAVGLGDTVASLLILIFGVSAAVTLLLRKRWGMGLATIAILATLCSIGLGVWQASLQTATRLQTVTAPEERIGFMVGAGCVIVFRLAMLVLYLVALFKFEKWSRGQAEPTVLQYENLG